MDKRSRESKVGQARSMPSYRRMIEHGKKADHAAVHTAPPRRP
jgi:hypothetical protein